MSAKLNAINIAEMFSEITDLQQVVCDIPLTSGRCNWIKRLITLRIELIEERLK
jgi:hypothetical protein